MGLVVLWSPAPGNAAAPAGRFTVMAGVVVDTKTGLTWQRATSVTTYTYANALTYCSKNTPGLPGANWRLPEIKELQSLVDYSAKVDPAIDTTAFPSTQSFYWSSTQRGTSNAWIVFFGTGGTYNNPLTTAYSVRCVR